ncbi:hypothetical protein GCM10027084_06860 [Pseudoxanthomonas sangjuensis]|uniref:HPF/RaiA family ribosome-associated protein n=1 Tax=Pseudoxanthomonas sangjuensis TaxID=1503750 RepID=UPI001390D24F|nr:HPF/RaiA family ribosome-associated protein [Pseudoxanthomonas sangjuensis]KAF1714137.1 RNA polymerase subunit sigma-54 [Pseudoxanthomonas sangjuensis]
MTPNVNVVFQGIDPSEALRADIARHAEKLGRFAKHLQGCNAVVGLEEGRHRQGNRYLVRLLASLPGGTATAEKAHEDAYVAAHQAFDALQRQIEDQVRIQRGD